MNSPRPSKFTLGKRCAGCGRPKPCFAFPDDPGEAITERERHRAKYCRRCWPAIDRLHQRDEERTESWTTTKR